MAWYVALALLAALAAFFPWELGLKADPIAPVPAGIRPEWYFVAVFHTLKLLPGRVLGLEGETIGVLVFSVAAVLLTLLPFLDREAAQGRTSRLFTVLGLGALGYFVLFTVIGYWAS